MIIVLAYAHRWAHSKGMDNANTARNGDTMQNIIVSRQQLKAHGIKRITDYRVEVIDHGHEPGTLSGANLKGAARKYAGKYAATRAEVATAVETVTGVTSSIARVDGRDVRVWTLDGEPVELTLVD